MIISVVILGILTILLLIFEETLTSGLGPKAGATQLHNSTLRPHPNSNLESNILSSKAPQQIDPINRPRENKNCWIHEEFTIIRECHYCTDFELSSGTSDVCQKNGYKETIRCNISGDVERGCSGIPKLVQAQFWIFEILILVLFIIFSGIARLRWTQLERNTITQIERRLAKGH